MDIKSLRNKVGELIEPVVNELGMSLDYLELARMRGKFLLRVFIEKEGGVTLDDCENASRDIEAVLDVEDPIPSAYTLEVSSPGIDRPLRKPEDFKRFLNRMARITTSRPVENQSFFVGEIIEAGDDGIVLLLPKDRKVSIRYEDVTRARLEVMI
jgi:ribosome maturation factor RimP